MGKIISREVDQKRPSNEPRSNKRSRLGDFHNFHITLKQWKMLNAVVDHGSFAFAAEELHVSQSAISYTVAKIQEQLGIDIFRIVGRKAELTVEGRELLKRTRHLIKEAAEVELFAEKLRQGWGTEVRFATTSDFPVQVLSTALRGLARLDTKIKVSIIEGCANKAQEALYKQSVDMAIMSHVPFGLHGCPLIEVEYVLIAHPNNALFRLGRTINTDDLERELQIIIGEESREKSDDDHHKKQSQKWYVSSFDTTISALLENIGYAWLPRHRVEKYLNDEALKVLPFNQGRTYKHSLYLVHGPSNRSKSLSTFAELLQHAALEKQETNRPINGFGAA